MDNEETSAESNIELKESVVYSAIKDTQIHNLSKRTLDDVDDIGDVSEKNSAEPPNKLRRLSKCPHKNTNEPDLNVKSEDSYSVNSNSMEQNAKGTHVKDVSDLGAADLKIPDHSTVITYTSGRDVDVSEEPSEGKSKIIKMEGDLPDIPLPSGWLGLNHKSGGIVYLHKETRTLTWSRPYTIDKKASVRRHDIPIVAIPCLHQVKALLKQKMERKKQKMKEKGKVVSSTGDGPPITHSSQEFELISPETLQKYLERIFKFDELTSYEEHIPRFYDDVFDVKQARERSAMAAKGQLPKEFNSIPFLKQNTDVNGLLAAGKNPKAILHEYTQLTFRSVPDYREMISSDASEFSYKAVLNGVVYGVGKGKSKKFAQNMAAEKSLEIIFPEAFKKIKDYKIDKKTLELFDQMDMLDERVYPASSKLGLHPPSAILAKSMVRNNGIFKSCKIEFDVTAHKDTKTLDYEMNVGSYKVKGTTLNRKTAKQIASQAMLKEIHPDFKCWGSILRLYEDELPDKLFKDVKQVKDSDVARLGLYETATRKNTELIENIKKEIKRVADELALNENENQRDPFLEIVERSERR